MSEFDILDLQELYIGSDDHSFCPCELDTT